MRGTSRVEERNGFIDAIKGVLILLVIIGHILPGTLEDNPIRYVIYSFHMPAFFFISGYLLNFSRLQRESFHTIIVRYAKRLLIPWLVAIHVYYFIQSLSSGFSFGSYLKAYIMPYYHLWFTIGYCFCILVVVLVTKFIRHQATVPKVVLVLGLIFVALYFLRLCVGKTNILIQIIEHTVRPWNMAFFGLGFYIHNDLWGGVLRERLQKFLWAFVALYFILLPVGYRFQGSVCEPLIRFAILGVIFSGINLQDKKRPVRVLSRIGENTYPIYLWHVIGKTIAINRASYYDAAVGWVIVLFVLLRLIDESNSLRKVIGR